MKDASQQVAPEDLTPEGEIVRRAREIIERTGRTKIQIHLRRDPEGEFPEPIRLRHVEELNDLSALIYRAHGGGPFEYKVRAAGQFVSGWEEIQVAGRPRPLDEDLDDEELEDEDGDEDAGDEPDVALDVDAIAAAVLAKIDATRAEKEQKAAEQRAIVAPLIAELEALKTKIVPVQASPEVAALKAQIDTLTQRLAEKDAAEKKAGEESRFKALTDELASQRKLLEEKLATPKKTKKSKFGPLGEMVGMLTGLAAAEKAISSLSERADNSGEGGLLEGALEVVREPFERMVRDWARDLERQHRRGKKQRPSGGPTLVPDEFVKWVELVFVDQPKVADVEFVRASLVKHRPQLEALASVHDEKRLFEVVTAVLGPGVSEQMQKTFKPEQVKGLLGLCARLRLTIEQTKTTPPPSAEGPSGPDEEEDEEDEGDEEKE